MQNSDLVFMQCVDSVSYSSTRHCQHLLEVVKQCAFA